MQKQGDVYTVAEASAQEFLRGEIEYEVAVSMIEAQLDHGYRSENPCAAEMYAQELLDEQLMELESAAFDERRFYDFVNEAAQRVMCGAMDYYDAIDAVKKRLGSVYVRRNPCAAEMAAQGILDDALDYIKIRSG